MQALSTPSRPEKQPFPSARLAVIGAYFRMLWPGRAPSTRAEQGEDAATLQDAHLSMRCGNHARSWRVLSAWLRSRGNQPEDYGWLSAHIFNWQDGRVISHLTEARIAQLLALRRSSEVLKVVAQRLAIDPHFRPSSAADTLSLAQVAARGGAPRISQTLLSDFSVRFAGDPRVSVSEALKRRLNQQVPAGTDLRLKRDGASR
jgi:hypothetical protein